MRSTIVIFIWLSMLLLATSFSGCGTDEVPAAATVPLVVKTNPMRIYMHYMPWFQSKDVSGFWGSHWRMSNRNPDIIDEAGKRQIASHYYPLIGPYDSKDPDVIEYHMLLMKYAGVDGVLIDWYGIHNVYDYRVNLTASNALIDKLDETGLQFAIAYEEYTAENVGNQTSLTAMKAASQDLIYMNENYFSRADYIRVDDKPLLLTFGPRYFRQASQWTELFSAIPTQLNFVPLWHHSSYVGANGNGEFSWVDFDSSLTGLNTFYNKYLNVQIGSAYPRFHDYYAEGGQGDGYGFVDFDNGETWRKTLELASQRNAKYLQLVTWNDFGEGTNIEPTLENEFFCLQKLQEFTGVSYGLSELELVHTYYLKKKQYANNNPALEKVKEMYKALSFLEVDRARTILTTLD